MPCFAITLLSVVQLENYSRHCSRRSTRPRVLSSVLTRMAAVAAAIGTLTSASIVSSTKAAASSSSTSGRRAAGVRRLSLHGGLKAQNDVMALGQSLSTEQQFSTLRMRCSAKSASSKGGALASKCDVASEILTVVPIMSALVLVGIAIGFVLLRVEAAVEDSE